MAITLKSRIEIEIIDILLAFKILEYINLLLRECKNITSEKMWQEKYCV